MQTQKPKILFKYKSVIGRKTIKNTFDIFKNNQIYLPNCAQLNDPFEGNFTQIGIGVAGNGIYAANDMKHYHFTEILNQFKILSFSETAFSPQMWAYYTDSYKGICIGFYNNSHFKNLKQVQYSMPSDNFKLLDNHNTIEKIIRSDLTHKHIDWAHEKEWRIISKTNENFLNFSPQDIACVIVGENSTINIKKLKRMLPVGTPVLKTFAGNNSFRIRLLEYDYELQFEGFEPPFIDTDKELYNYLLKQRSASKP